AMIGNCLSNLSTRATMPPSLYSSSAMGTMVFSLCRRLLDHEQDAEDAFQATFLVLARKAKSGNWQGSVAGWLHEVAFRTALKARGASRRQREAERRGYRTQRFQPSADSGEREHSALLHEELNRLPEKYRTPLVLCYLEGKSHT